MSVHNYLFIVFLLLLPPITQAQQCRQTVKLGLVDDWPPLTYFHNGEAAGLDIEIAKKVFNRINVCLTYVKLPSSARALEQMESGQIDVAVMVSYTPHRAKYGYFSIPYRQEKMRLFSLAPPRPLGSLAQLLDEANSVGLSIGSFYGEELAALARNPKYQQQLVGISSASRRSDMLVRKRVDFIIDDLITGLYITKIKGHSQIKPWPYVVHDNEVHILLRRTPENKALMNEINQAIAKLQSEINKLVSDYTHH
ncbi:substrate-binding periplasmic protein [Pseudoalteromonas sp. T1lg23B]|uniref:substrate-binding periplasmic protein n=1 Tax=Pseudoalteromonas sp. T1lg23B TaxID=2077097 RepID=UPI001319CA9F|nr:transporter substrate-binding domain-containing protein [Pseudoalteromonas sp. T1lg23B]